MFNKQDFRLRPLNISDEERIFIWRNQEHIRRNMYTDHLISKEDHHQWFSQTLKDPSKSYLIFQVEQNPIGLVYFTGIDSRNSKCDWGFYLGEEASPRGSGFVMEFMALSHVFSEISIRKLCCEVFAFNISVIKQHKRFGFQEEGILKKHIFKDNQYQDVVKLALFEEVWQEYEYSLNKKYFTPPPHNRLVAKCSQPLVISVVSNEESWINEYLYELILDWFYQGHQVEWTHHIRDLQGGDLCFYLSCSEIVPASILSKFKQNLVVHESDLPQGKGWSPLTWQILEGKNDIPVTLFEAAKQVDSGNIYLQQWLHFQGHETIDKLRHAQSQATLKLCKEFVREYPDILKRTRPQVGKSSFYPRRTPQDSKLDPHISIANQFNLLRIVDNERYPAFFEWAGQLYIVKIYVGLTQPNHG